MRALIAAVCLAAGAASLAAAERPWQEGTWTDISIKRQMFDFGPGSSPFGQPGGGAPSLRAMADVRVYVIETAELRIEIQDVVPIGRRSVDAEIGDKVTFALDKNTIYIKGVSGIEHKLRVTKKTQKARR
jgi:hypothetical protein